MRDRKGKLAEIVESALRRFWSLPDEILHAPVPLAAILEKAKSSETALHPITESWG